MTGEALPMDRLEAEFPPGAVKKLEYGGKVKTDERGNPIEYIGSHAVIGRLNEAFGGAWAFEVPWQQVGEDFVAVRGRLSAWGHVKEQFGSAEIKRYKPEHATKAGQIVDIGNDLKAAASDALKKCASLFGVGLYLQDKEGRAQARREGGKPPARPATPPAPITPEEERERLAAAAGRTSYPRTETGWRVHEERAEALGKQAQAAGWSREKLIEWLGGRGKAVLRELTNIEADELETALTKQSRIPF